MKQRKLVYGFGINDADYTVKVQETVGYVGGRQIQKMVWRCPFYDRWCNMLRRCYSKSFKSKVKTYQQCSVCENWRYFSNFKAWMEQQDWQGKELDKDILFPGNKIYSPETCCFIEKEVNSLVVESVKTLGNFLSGVYFNKKRSKFYAQCCNKLGDGKSYLGSFDTELEAHIAWLNKKIEMVEDMRPKITNDEVYKALIKRYTERKAKAQQDNLKEKIEELEEIEEIQNRYS